jgi:hypothetical protein
MTRVAGLTLAFAVSLVVPLATPAGVVGAVRGAVAPEARERPSASHAYGYAALAARAPRCGTGAPAQAGRHRRSGGMGIPRDACSSVAIVAARPPTARERRTIKVAAMRDCRRKQGDIYPCKWRGGVTVSTTNRRYAWANVSGPSYNHSGILKRRTPRGNRWRVLRVVGGGIQPCSYWYEVAPPAVVSDLKVRGFTEGEGFEYRRC